MQAVLIQGGEVYAPEPRGIASLLLIGDRIAFCGASDSVDRAALERAGLDVGVIDAIGKLVLPGFVDSHEHLSGGSGEHGYASQTPSIGLGELVLGGITTVVGCIGVDTTTKSPEALLAKVKGLREEGLGAFCYSGGYDVPSVTLTGSVRRDMLLVEEVIGAGEVAISDRRSSQPNVEALAKIVADAYVGGILTGKAGVTHFHVGDGEGRLAPLRELLLQHDVGADSLYPTHVQRNLALLQEAAHLTTLGVSVDMDVVNADLVTSVAAFKRAGGELSRLTASSDAAITQPAALLQQVRALVLEGVCSLEQAVSLITSNPARVLRLHDRGRLEANAKADVVVSGPDLQLEHVWAGGRRMVSDGRLCVRPRFLENSTREVNLRGSKA